METGNSIVGSRIVFENAKKAMVANGLDVESAVLSQSYLRLEVPLSANLSSYNFPVLVNTQYNGLPNRPTEQRLKLQDAFYASTLQVFTALATSATDTAFTLKSYPSPLVYTTSGAAQALYTFYNGKITVSVNNTILVPGFPLSRFLQVYQTQETGATNSPLDQFDGANEIVLQPNPVFIGQKDNVFNITLPSNVAVVEANTYMVVILFGVLAQNVTVVS